MALKYRNTAPPATALDTSNIHINPYHSVLLRICPVSMQADVHTLVQSAGSPNYFHGIQSLFFPQQPCLGPFPVIIPKESVLCSIRQTYLIWILSCPSKYPLYCSCLIFFYTVFITPNIMSPLLFRPIFPFYCPS